VINTGVPLWGFSGWCDGSEKVPGMSLTYSHTLSPLELFQMQIDVERNFCFAPQKLTLTTPLSVDCNLRFRIATLKFGFQQNFTLNKLFAYPTKVRELKKKG